MPRTVFKAMFRKMHGDFISAAYSGKVLGYGPIAYWQLDEAAGGVAFDSSGNGYDGAYTGVTLGQPGIGDGKTAPLFDGANDFVNVFSAGFQGAWDGDEFTVSIWAKVFNVGVWTDGNFRRVLQLQVNANNRMLMHKSDVNNTLLGFRRANGTTKSISDGGHNETDYFHLALTASRSAGATGELKFFHAGSQVGITQTNINNWAGLLFNTTTVLGASNTVPAAVWYGYLAHCAVFDSALAPAAIADLAVVV